MKIWYDDDPEVVKILDAFAAFRNICDKSPIDGLERWARKEEDALLDEIQATSWEERPVLVGQRFLMTQRLFDQDDRCIVTHIETRNNTVEFNLEFSGNVGVLAYAQKDPTEPVKWIDIEDSELIELVHVARNSEVDPRD